MGKRIVRGSVKGLLESANFVNKERLHLILSEMVVTLSAEEVWNLIQFLDKNGNKFLTIIGRLNNLPYFMHKFAETNAQITIANHNTIKTVIFNGTVVGYHEEGIKQCLIHYEQKSAYSPFENFELTVVYKNGSKVIIAFNAYEPKQS